MLPNTMHLQHLLWGVSLTGPFTFGPVLLGSSVQCRRDHSATFCSEFFKFITPALLVYKQEPVVTRTINFVAAFATARDPVSG